MSSSDEDELAQLRRDRAARLGSAGLTITSLRHKLEQGNLAQARGNQAPHDTINGYEDQPTVVDAAELRNAAPEEDEDGDGDGIPEEFRAHFPTSFGAAPKKAPTQSSRPLSTAQRSIENETATTTQKDQDQDPFDIGPPRPPPETNEYAPGPSYAEYLAAQEPEPVLEDPWRLPITSEAVLDPHGKAVVALDVDHSGSRLVTGSHDYTVKIFDFNGMKSDCKPFKSFEPTEGHPIVALSWSPSGEGFLVVTGSPQPKIYDRDGKELGELPRGDMYIRDMKNTKGHVTACSGGAWHPVDKGTGLTSSEDGTLRVWDLWTLDQKTVIKPTLAKPGRVAVTACTWSHEGRLIGGGLMDGTLQLWDVRGKFGHSAAVGAVLAPKAQGVQQQKWSFVSQTGQLLRGAHESGNEITCLRFSSDGYSLLTRGADETLKLWDIRKFKTPVAVAEGLPTLFGNTQCCFSPDGKLVLTGVSPPGKEGSGAVAIFDRSDLSLVRRLGVPGSAVAVAWSPKINQIFVGCGDRKEGTTRVLYDTTYSTRGALLSHGRRPRAESNADYTVQAAPEIYNPNALPMYRQVWPGGGGGKRKAPVDASIRTAKSFKPDTGQAGVAKGAQGKLGSTGGTLLTQYIMKHQGQLKNPGEEDVRASILRHAGKEDEMSLFTKAYASTQPKKIYAEPEEDDEDGDAVGPQPPPP